MAAVILGGAVMGLVVVTAVTAAKGELNVTRADLAQKQAYEAARAGIADYAFHLNQDTNFWTQLCQRASAFGGQPDGLDRQAPAGPGIDGLRVRDRADPTDAGGPSAWNRIPSTR